MLKETLISFIAWKWNISEEKILEYEYNIGADLKPKRIYEDTALKTLPNVLYLSKMVKENSQFLKTIYDWFANTLSEQFSLEDTAKSIHSDNQFKENFLKFLKDQDIDILDISVDKGSLAEQIIKNNDFYSRGSRKNYRRS